MRRAGAIVALVTLTAPAAAEAGVDRARFVAFVEGRQETTWSMPRHMLGGDCKGKLYRTAHGSEVTTFRSKPARLLAYRPNPQAGVAILYGTWNPLATGADHLTASGKITRAQTEVYDIEQGPCGPREPEPMPHTDCGTELFKPQVWIRWYGDRVEVDVDEPRLPFLNCPLFSPDRVEQGDFTDGVTQRYPVRDLFDRSQGLVEVLGRKTLTQKLNYGTTKTTIKWKLRLRRAR